jgi:hypothetical protein
MNNTCAFCAQLVEHFIRCNECGEAICADHRTLMPVGERPPYAGTGLETPARYLCPRHVGLLRQELATGESEAQSLSMAGPPDGSGASAAH